MRKACYTYCSQEAMTLMMISLHVSL